MERKDHPYIHQLFQKFLNNACTPEEAEELLRLLGKGAYREQVEAAIEKHLDSRSHAEADAHGDALDRIYNRLAMAQDEVSGNRGRRKRRLISIASAAAILLAVAAGLFWYNRDADVASDIATRVYDVAPGGTRATLTLADGRTIALDKTIGDTLAQEGGTHIYQAPDGLIVYDRGQPGNTEAVKELTNTISTPRGGQYQVILPDGTQVWLNAASSLRYPVSFTGSERRVTLTGEAYFQVQPDVTPARKPFIVETRGQRVEVIATDFNINSYENEESTRTTLFEGSVRVVAASGTALLKPGQQAVEAQGSIHVRPADRDAVADWKNGDFIFAEEGLHSIMRRLARWYDVEVVYEDTIANEVYGGQISRSKKLSEVLRILELSGGLRFRIEKNTVYISR